MLYGLIVSWNKIYKGYCERLTLLFTKENNQERSNFFLHLRLYTV